MLEKLNHIFFFVVTAAGDVLCAVWRPKKVATYIVHSIVYIFSSPEPKAHKVSLKYTSRAGVRPSVRLCVPASVNTFKPVLVKTFDFSMAI